MLFWPVILTLAVYWAALIHELGAQWSVYDQYNYGWAVPFLCLFLAWERYQKAVRRQQEAGEQKSLSPGSFRKSGFILLIGSALLYAPTRFFHEANPIWRLTSWLWALETIVITFVLLDFAFQAARANKLSRPAVRALDFVFPICFFLVAVPWPSGAEAFMVQTLTRLNVAATVEGLGWLGIPAMQHGNVIEVATGNVGVSEACSGIRSFQATLMISLFFGEFYSLNVARRIACVFAGLGLSFLFNMVRTTLLTWVAATRGTAAIHAWHDPAGVTVLVACFITLWVVALWLGRKPKAQNSGQGGGATNEGGSASTGNFQISTALVRRLAIALLVWFILVEVGTQFWFRSHEKTMTAQTDWSVNLDATNPSLTKVEIPPDIRVQFKADENDEARWRDDAGDSWQLYYFRWLPAHSLDKRVAIQLAKTHGPEKCLPAIGMTMQTDLGVVTVPVGDREFAFRQYVFMDGDQPLNVFYAIYEDQTGTTALANRRLNTASRMAAAFAGSRNDGQRFLEIAVAGPENPEQAKAALAEQLKRLITPVQ